MFDKIKNILSVIFGTVKKINYKKVILSIIILLLIAGIWYLSDNWKNFVSIILVVFTSFLISCLFDVTKIIHYNVKQIKENTNEENYRSLIESYNQLLFFFGQTICSFLKLNLDDSLKGLIQASDRIENILENLKNLKNEKLIFQRNNEQNWHFDTFSANVLPCAEEDLADINRILMYLPKELKFARDRYAQFIKLQSSFHQLKNQLINDSGTNASEIKMQKFITDLINFIEIK